MPSGLYARKVKDLTGRKFGMLTAIKFKPKDDESRGGWICVCDCGEETVVFSTYLILGSTKSCGCRKGRWLKGGLQPVEEIDGYQSWHSMVSRCSPGYPNSKNYYDRGIRIADCWRGKDGARRFLEHMGPKPSPSHSVDRINNDGNYEPGNVRWATKKEQIANQRKRCRIDEWSTEDMYQELRKRGEPV